MLVADTKHRLFNCLMKKNKQTKNVKKVSQSGGKAVTRSNPPAAYGVTAKTEMPRISGYSDRIRIRRREFIGTATNGSTTGFMLTGLSSSVPGYDFNPGVGTMFPWLSNLSSSFERFRFTQLDVHVIPSQSTATAGRYYLSVDYDFDDPAATSKVQMMGNRTAVESAIWQEAHLRCVPAELHRDMPTKYISTMSRNNFVEPRTAYCGFLMVAFDTPTTNCLLDLWVEYDVELISPVNDDIVVQDTISAMTNVNVSELVSVWGTGYLGVPPMSVVQAPGPIFAVTPGINGTPPMSITYFGQTGEFAGKVIDVGRAQGGKIDVMSKAILTGASPSTILQAGFDTVVAVMDSLGAPLAYLTTTNTAFQKSTGVVTPTNISVNNANTYSLFSILLDTLNNAYPTARFLAPFLVGTAALAAPGSSVVGYRFEL